jgi:hypothetical protein
MRIKHVSGRRSDGGPPKALDHGVMSVVARGKYNHYYPSASVEAIIRAWPHGVAIEFEVDDDTRRVTVYLSPASDGQGIKLRSRETQRPFLPIPTRAIGTLQGGQKVIIEEVVISDREIAVNTPFTPRASDETA